ncbi:MAG TPA: hypothetical protein VGP47_05885, partial [Parachlamydiaceae bacterium]|nr:hypothetical protein [Parachlamydiaceae bacterium]
YSDSAPRGRPPFESGPRGRMAEGGQRGGYNSDRAPRGRSFDGASPAPRSSEGGQERSFGPSAHKKPSSPKYRFSRKHQD